MRTIILTILFSLIISSCSNSEQDQGHGISDFIVSEITNSSLSLISANSDIANIPSDIKNKAVYNLRICLKDPAVNNPISDNDFNVAIDGVSQKITTDNSGCSLVFVALVSKANSCEKVEIKDAVISGLGNYKGSTKLKLAFNKTAKTTSSFIDMRYNNISESEISECKSSEVTVSNFTLNHQKDSRKLSFEMNMEMALKQYLRDNSFDLSKLNGQAQFDIEYHLVADGQEGLKVLDIVKSKSTLSELGLRDIVNFQVSSKNTSNFSEFILEFSVVLSEQNIFLKKYYKTKAKNIFFDQATSLVQIDKLSFNNDEKSQDFSSFHESVELSDLVVVKESLNSSSKGLHNKNKKYTLKTCFVDAFNSSSLEDHAHKDILIVEDKFDFITLEKKNVQSDLNGCVTFDIVYNYNLFAKLSYEKSVLHFMLDGESYDIPFALHAQKPLVDLRKSAINKEEDITVEHELVVDSFTYGQLGNKDNSYFVNRFIQMYFEKKFFLEFSPAVLSRNKGKEIDLASSINFGKLKIKYHYLIGKDSQESRDTLDLSRFDLISTGESTAQISKTGNVHTEFNLPLEVSDALYLSTKGYLVLDIAPLDELSDLAPVRMAFEFFGTSTKEVSTSIVNFTTSDFDEQESLGSNESHLEKLIAKSFSNKTTKLSSDLFYDYLINKPRFSNLVKINSKEALSREDFKSAKINALDLRLISKIEKKIPKAGGLSDKLCELIYPNYLEIISRRDCRDNIESHIKVSSGEHIEEIVYLNLFEQRNKVAGATFEKNLEVNDGALTRGYGYMAAGGDRSGVTKGEHSGVSESISSSVFYDGPPGVLMLSAGISKSHEVFTNTDNSKYQMLMNRFSSDITPVKLNYNAIGLTFPANVRKCTLIEALKRDDRSLFVCDEKLVKKMITQKWFYIGEMDARKNGVLSDGVKVGDKSYLKIIRGEEIFNQIWSKFKQEDSKALIVEVEGESLGEKLLEYKRSELINLEFEINKDSNFPGLLK